MKSLFIALLCLPLVALADGLPSQPYIYVQGAASMSRSPDVVTLEFKLVTHDPDEAAANRAMQARVTRVLALLDQARVAGKDVEAQSFRAEAQYEDDDRDVPSGKRGKLKGYAVTREFTVTIRDVAAFPTVIDQLLALGVEEFTSITPGLSDRKDLEKQTRIKALADARDQAEQTLQAEGMKIASVFAVSPTAFGEIRQNFFQEGNVFPAFTAGTHKIDPTQYRLTPVEVSQTVHVIYLISPAK